MTRSPRSALFGRVQASFLPITVTSVGTSGSYGVTVFGASLGFTNADVVGLGILVAGRKVWRSRRSPPRLEASLLKVLKVRRALAVPGA